jgi:hypothetical protein
MGPPGLPHKLPNSNKDQRQSWLFCRKRKAKKKKKKKKSQKMQLQLLLFLASVRCAEWSITALSNKGGTPLDIYPYLFHKYLLFNLVEKNPKEEFNNKIKYKKIHNFFLKKVL